MQLIIGIDDTDNLESRGTGHLARMLALELAQFQLAEIENIVRHQLFVHKDIPFTSHNSSASIVCKSLKSKIEIIAKCREILLRESAIGSDAGLCVAELDAITPEIKSWGENAKKIILNLAEAHRIAEKSGVYLEGLTGKRIGVIGALAAIGLRATGNDGRILWLPNLRETQGTFNIDVLKKIIPIEVFETVEGSAIPDNSEIILTDWTRPIVKNNKITLIVEKYQSNENQYIIVSKEYIKSITE